MNENEKTPLAANPGLLLSSNSTEGKKSQVDRNRALIQKITFAIAIFAILFSAFRYYTNESLIHDGLNCRQIYYADTNCRESGGVLGYTCQYPTTIRNITVYPEWFIKDKVSANGGS